MMQPILIHKVYNEDGDFLGVLDDVISEFSVRYELNTAGSSVNIELGRNSDSIIQEFSALLDEDNDPILDEAGFQIETTTNSRNKIGPSSLINHNYRVDICAFYNTSGAILDEDDDPILDEADGEILDEGGGSESIVFSGFIADIDINFGGDEKTSILLYSFGYDLDQYVVTSSGNTTVAFLSDDVSDIVKDGLDLFNAQANSPVTYDVSTVDTASWTVSYTFNTNTYLELMQKCIELAPADWYWYLDQGTNLIHFKERPSTPDHYIYLGLHIENLDLNSSISEVVNDVLFSGGDAGSGDNLFFRSTTTPLQYTRRALFRQSDNRVTTTTYAEVMSESMIDRMKNVQYKSTISLLAATFPIATLAPGQVVGFRNFGNFVDELELQITAVTFMLDKAIIEVNTLLPKVNKRIEDIRRNLIAQETIDNPSAPAT